MFNNDKKQELPIYYFWRVIIFKLFCFFVGFKKKNSKRLIDNIWLPLVPYKKICKQYLK